LLASARNRIEHLRKQARPKEPEQLKKRENLIAEVLNTLHLSLRSRVDVPPDALYFAARRVVDVVISGQQRKAVNARYALPRALKDKEAKLQAIYASGKYPSKGKCALIAGGGLGLSPDAARRALKNQPKPSPKKASTRNRVI
jgi:hypothetical protein